MKRHSNKYGRGYSGIVGEVKGDRTIEDSLVDAYIVSQVAIDRSKNDNRSKWYYGADQAAYIQLWNEK